METKFRSLIKSIIWRIMATINGFIITYLFTNKFGESLIISITANITGLILYYFHERFWNKIQYGLTK